MSTEIQNFNSISRENNMNAVRYYLVLCIIFSHFAILSQSNIIALPRIFGTAGSFFVLSGFLMFPSFEKYQLTGKFLIRRARRILPPYLFFVVFFAVFLVFFSDLSFKEYFSNSVFWKYLISNSLFLNYIYPDLPGVFTSATNITSNVNGALWTMKMEVICYLTVPLIFLFWKKTKCRPVATLMALMLLFLGVYLVMDLIENGVISGRTICKSYQARAIMLFYTGGLINYYLPVIQRYKYQMFAIALFIFSLGYIPVLSNTFSVNFAYWNVVLPFNAGLLVILCTIIGKYGKFVAGHEAVSYEVYLMHWPMIQIFVQCGFVEKYGAYPTLACLIISCLIFAIITNKFIFSHFTKKKSPRISSPTTASQR